MKILILNGSPRHQGNTYTVLQMMYSQLKKEHTVNILDICSMKLSGCVACNACKKNGGHCVCPDESDAVIQKIGQADAIILGTPVYWWGMSAQLKMVVDKFYSQVAAFKAMSKRIGVVAVGGNSLEDSQYGLIRDQFACIAQYLNWTLAFSLPLCAYEPGELLKQDDLAGLVHEACTAITK